MNAGMETFVDNYLAAAPVADAQHAASLTIDYNEQVQKAIEGFQAADALLAEWEAKKTSAIAAE